MGDRIRAAGKTIVAAHEEQLGAVLAAQLQPIIAPPYRIETGTIADSEGRRGGPFAALICKGGQPIAAVGADAVIPIESVAVVFDVTHTLDLNSLATAYERIAAAKAMRKTTPAPGMQTIEATLGVIFAADATVPLEELADELERLNERTLSDQWADLVVVAKKGQISYSVQMVGSSKLDGILLPTSPAVKDGTIFAFYAVMLICASSGETFNLAMHTVVGQLVRWAPGYILSADNSILEGVSRQGITRTGYQYNLAGQLRPAPPEHYQGRSLPPRSVGLYPRDSKEPLGVMTFLLRRR